MNRTEVEIFSIGNRVVVIRNMSAIGEFEAEAASFLVCSRKDIANPSDQYLSGYLDNHDEIPRISPETITNAEGLIEQMGTAKMKPRKE